MYSWHYQYIYELDYFFPAVHYEEKNYDECISVCTKATEIGRDNRADFKLIAK